MREIVVEEDSIALAEQTGWYQRKMMFVGVKGCPDRWFFKRGLMLIVEFKRRDKQPDGHQVRRHRELREAGMKVHVIDSFDGFQKLLASAEAEIARLALIEGARTRV